MPHHRVVASAEINAPASRLYAILADYRTGHPQIIPRPPFGALEVEHGGVGAGTVIRCEMRVLGRMQVFRATIAEPEPGRVLVETDSEDGVVTMFTVDPCNDGRSAKVTISTDIKTRGGLLGALQRFFATRLLRPVYVRELKQLAAVAEKQFNS